MEKKTKDNPLVIPYKKAVRIGNFKLWRSRYSLVSGKEKSDIDCLHVSNLDGSWMVRIPSTMMMFSTILNGYATVDEKLRDNFLGMILTNVYNCSTCSSEALHDAFFILTEMMTYPYMLLPEKEMEKRMKDGMKAAGMEKDRIKEHVSNMMDYRHRLYELIERKKDAYIAEYERQQAERRAKEEEALKQLEHDEIAEQAMEILNNKEEKEDKTN